MKQKKRWMRSCVMVLALLLVSLPALARKPSPYGPEGKRFGAGLYLGEPIGFTLKGYLTERWSLAGAAGWSFVDDSFALKFDGLYDFLDIPVDTSVITLPFYAGIGGFFSADGGNDDNAEGGILIPVGLAVQWTNYPVEAFLEIEPGIAVAPATDFELMGGIGARFYF